LPRGTVVLCRIICLTAALCFPGLAPGQQQERAGGGAQAAGAELAQVSGQYRSLYREGRYREAKALYRESLQLADAVFGTDREGTTEFLADLANFQLRHGPEAAAVPTLRRLLILRESFQREKPANYRATLDHLVSLYLARGNNAEAEALYRQALAAMEKNLGPSHPELIPVLGAFGDLLRRGGKPRRAEPLYSRGSQK
jgi:tetratricopeptide (TPR) repeat protein